MTRRKNASKAKVHTKCQSCLTIAEAAEKGHYGCIHRIHIKNKKVDKKFFTMTPTRDTSGALVLVLVDDTSGQTYLGRANGLDEIDPVQVDESGVVLPPAGLTALVGDELFAADAELAAFEVPLDGGGVIRTDGNFRAYESPAALANKQSPDVLALACRSRSFISVQLLLAKGYPITDQAIHNAVSVNNWGILKLLIKRLFSYKSHSFNMRSLLEVVCQRDAQHYFRCLGGYEDDPLFFLNTSASNASHGCLQVILERFPSLQVDACLLFKILAVDNDDKKVIRCLRVLRKYINDPRDFPGVQVYAARRKTSTALRFIRDNNIATEDVNLASLMDVAVRNASRSTMHYLYNVISRINKNVWKDLPLINTSEGLITSSECLKLAVETGYLVTKLDIINMLRCPTVMSDTIMKNILDSLNVLLWKDKKRQHLIVNIDDILVELQEFLKRNPEHDVLDLEKYVSVRFLLFMFKSCLTYEPLLQKLDAFEAHMKNEANIKDVEDTIVDEVLTH